MKKIMALVCACGIVAGASAQVDLKKSDALLNATMEQSEAVPFSLVRPGAQPKAQNDTLGVYNLMDENAMWSYTWVNFNSDPNPVTADNLNDGHRCVKFVYGSYVLNYMIGSGEIGYWFPVGPGSWYVDVVLGGVDAISGNYVTGAGVWLATVNRGAQETRNDSMPLQFKLYNSERVSDQAVLTDHNAIAGQATAQYDDVTYPTDPDDAILSYTTYVPQLPAEDNGQAGSNVFWASFQETPLAGDDFCISVVFPHDGAVTDTLWNVAILQESDGIQAEWLHAVYGVMSFPGQMFWTSIQDGDTIRPEERFEGFVEDESMQPNVNYAVFAMDAFNLFSNEKVDAEPAIFFAISDEVSIKSQNTVDRYVQVSPVPAVDYVDITSSKYINYVEIYGLNGGLLNRQQVNGNQVTVNVSGLNSGMYLMKVYTENGVANKKIVVR